MINVEKAREKLSEVEKSYLQKFGQNSLDRVIFCDPLDCDSVKNYTDGIKILERAINLNVPLEQTDPKIWNTMVF